MVFSVVGNAPDELQPSAEALRCAGMREVGDLKPLFWKAENGKKTKKTIEFFLFIAL